MPVSSGNPNSMLPANPEQVFVDNIITPRHVEWKGAVMKWHQLYNWLTIKEDQPDDPEISHFFERMARGNAFALYATHVVCDDEGYEKFLFCPQDVNVLIMQVSADLRGGDQVLQITFKTIGRLPPGLKHGTFVCTFRDGKDCYNLPADMFMDKHVPEDELSTWTDDEP